jgi:hypothetical protein
MYPETIATVTVSLLLMVAGGLIYHQCTQDCARRTCPGAQETRLVRGAFGLECVCAPVPVRP